MFENCLPQQPFAITITTVWSQEHTPPTPTSSRKSLATVDLSPLTLNNLLFFEFPYDVCLPHFSHEGLSTIPEDQIEGFPCFQNSHTNWMLDNQRLSISSYTFYKVCSSNTFVPLLKQKLLQWVNESTVFVNYVSKLVWSLTRQYTVPMLIHSSIPPSTHQLFYIKCPTGPCT